jgi:hypothetical protein
MFFGGTRVARIAAMFFRGTGVARIAAMLFGGTGVATMLHGKLDDFLVSYGFGNSFGQDAHGAYAREGRNTNGGHCFFQHFSSLLISFFCFIAGARVVPEPVLSMREFSAYPLIEANKAASRKRDRKTGPRRAAEFHRRRPRLL